MALKSLVMLYKLYQNKNAKSTVVGRWFAKPKRLGTLSTRALAAHMVEHGMVASRADVENILIRLSQCIPELVAQGYGVKLDGLGIFYPTIANTKGGAESEEKFNAAVNIAGVRFRFTPDSSDLDNLTSKAFGKKVTLQLDADEEE